jgi:hypothetical protein
MYLFYNNYNIRQEQERLESKYLDYLSTLGIEKANFRHVIASVKKRNTSSCSLTRFFLDNGFDCGMFMKACMFQGADLNCCAKKEILSDIGKATRREFRLKQQRAGKCFIVQSENTPQQTIPGPTGGMRLYINNWGELFEHRCTGS